MLDPKNFFCAITIAILESPAGNCRKIAKFCPCNHGINVNIFFWNAGKKDTHSRQYHQSLSRNGQLIFSWRSFHWVIIVWFFKITFFYVISNTVKVLLLGGINFHGFYKMHWCLNSWFRTQQATMWKLYFIGFRNPRK